MSIKQRVQKLEEASSVARERPRVIFLAGRHGDGVSEVTAALTVGHGDWDRLPDETEQVFKDRVTAMVDAR